MKPWELWFADFPFEENPNVVKNRPVIILNVEPLEVLSVKVTSQNARSFDKFDTPILKWKEAGLAKASVARVSKTMLLTIDRFTRRIGELDDIDKLAILNKYTEYLSTI